MIKVKHPLEQCNAQQEILINSLPDDQKDFHSLFFSHGNAAYHYYNLQIDPTEEDYDDWLQGLEGNLKIEMQKRGFEYCKGILSFSRYVREKRDIGLEDFLLNMMGPEDYEKYHNLVRANTRK